MKRSTLTGFNVFMIVLFFIFVGITAFYLQKWMKNRFSSSNDSTPQPTDEVTHVAVIDSGEPDEVLHAKVVDEDDVKRLVPPGGFPVSGCMPSDLHDHVSKEYAHYQSAPGSKAFVVHHDCEQSYAISGQHDTITATQKAYNSCNTLTPGHCGVVSVNDVVYSHD